jgi:hypothetical protein
LKKVSFDEKMVENKLENKLDEKLLDVQKWVKNSEDAESLLKNVEHEIANNSIVVKSVFG